MWIKSGAIYLRDTALTIMGLRIYGSPWQPEFCNCKAIFLSPTVELWT